MKKSLLFLAIFMVFMILVGCTGKKSAPKESFKYSAPSSYDESLSFERELTEFEKVTLYEDIARQCKEIQSITHKSYYYNYGSTQSYDYMETQIEFYDDTASKIKLKDASKTIKNGIEINDETTYEYYSFIFDGKSIVYTTSSDPKYSDITTSNASEEDIANFYLDTTLDVTILGSNETLNYYYDRGNRYIVYAKYTETATPQVVGNETKMQNAVSKKQYIMKVDKNGKILSSTVYTENLSNYNSKTGDYYDKLFTLNKQSEEGVFKYGKRKARPEVTEMLGKKTYLLESTSVWMDSASLYSKENVSKESFASGFADYSFDKKDINNGKIKAVVSLDYDNAFLTTLTLKYSVYNFTANNIQKSSKSVDVNLVEALGSDFTLFETTTGEKFFYTEDEIALTFDIDYSLNETTGELTVNSVTYNGVDILPFTD